MAQTAFSRLFWPKVHFKDPTYYWILHKYRFSKISKIFVLFICDSAEIYPNFEASLLGLRTSVPPETASRWRPILLTIIWYQAREISRWPTSSFLDLKGGHFSHFFARFSKILENFGFFFCFFGRALGYLQNDKKNSGHQSFLGKIWQIQKSGFLGPILGVPG